jgi:phosphatidylserine/phosphatidylglycerophosphate/cardiolipin synthase-like enzyme
VAHNPPPPTHEEMLSHQPSLVMALLGLVSLRRTLPLIARRTRAPLALLWLGPLVIILLAGLAVFWLETAGWLQAFLLSETPAAQAVEPAQAETAEAHWWQVYFTLGADGGCLEADAMADDQAVTRALVSQIEQAQESIYIAAFSFDLESVALALMDAARRGVEVVFITDDLYGLADDEIKYPQAPYFERLAQAGVQVQTDGSSGLMHNKFIIFDRKAVWTGSLNLTRNGVCRNNNNAVLIHSQALADIYLHEFEEMRRYEFGTSSPSTLAEQTVYIDGHGVRVFFAPEDQVLANLTPIIALSQQEVLFMAYSFTTHALCDEMVALHQQGVAVRGVFESRGSGAEHSCFNDLLASGADVRQDSNPAAMHHKVIILDRRYVITGSFNFSNSADQTNDENLIIIDDPVLAQWFIDEFALRWSVAQEPSQ